MSLWNIAEAAIFGVGILFVLAGDRLSLPILTYGGMLLFGMTSMLLGLQAMVTRHIVLGRRQYNETYMGVAAYVQGVQFMMLAAFFISVSVVAYFNSGQSTVQYFARRPGLVLIAIGVYCLMAAVIAIAGHQEEKQGERWIVILSLFTSRLFPGLILIVIGLGIFGLGALEIAAPQAFDNMGGGFLEVLFRK